MSKSHPMTHLTFAPPAYPSARIEARSGSVVVGAIFPMQSAGKVGWRLWITPSGGAIEHTARSDEAAKEALLSAWSDFLRAAELHHAKDHTP